MAADAKAAARDRIERAREQLLDLSHRIHAEPELGMEEERASAWLSDALSGAGFTVERGVGGLDTAFSARSGPGPFRVVVCAEYDALPGIGHACGHNVIAAMSVGAGLGLAAVADDVGVEVTVLGTPAEESGGGKIILLEQGALAGAHAAMMVHPSPFDVVETPIIAVDQLNVTYTGKAAHASALASLYRANAEALGRKFLGFGNLERTAGSTDMGNVSLAVPSIHPSIGIDSLPAVNHQPEFTAQCRTPVADKAVMDGAVAMAWTVIDAATDDRLRTRLMTANRPS